MGYHVLTIAMTEGADAEWVGRLVAVQLGYRYLHAALIPWAAEQAGVSPQQVADLTAAAAAVTRILDTLAAVGVAEQDAGAVATMSLPAPAPVSGPLIQAVIHQAAASGAVVVVGHAAGLLLAGMPGLLRVFVTASAEVRARRVAARLGLEEAQARERIAQGDRERRTYLQQVHQLAEEQPTHYDLVLNTDVLTPGEVAHLIGAAASGRGAQEHTRGAPVDGASDGE